MGNCLQLLKTMVESIKVLIMAVMLTSAGAQVEPTFLQVTPAMPAFPSMPMFPAIPAMPILPMAPMLPAAPMNPYPAAKTLKSDQPKEQYCKDQVRMIGNSRFWASKEAYHFCR